MGKKMITCPGCKAEHEIITPDYPTTAEIAAAIKQEMSVGEEQAHVFVPSITEYVEHCKICPAHGKELDDYLMGQRESWMKGLTTEEIKKLAMKSGIYPPPRIRIDDGMLSSRGRR